MHADLFSHVDPSPPATTGGTLGGTSVVIQPNVSVRAWPTEAGSVALERFAAIEDAAAVERLRAAGAAIVGSSRMAELGFGLAGDTTARILDEGACDAAMLIDMTGESRVAAAMAGALGLKPSFGIVSRFGLIGLVPSMECTGVVAKTPGDLADLMAVLVGTDPRDPSMRQDGSVDFAKVNSDPDGVTVVGVIRECVDALAPVDADAFHAALKGIEADRTRVEQVSLPDFDLFRTVHNVVGSTEASSSAGKYDGVRYGHRAAGTESWNEMYLKSRAESFGSLVKTYVFQGAYFQFENYPAFENACRIRRRLVEAYAALFEKVDVLVCPTRRSDRDAGGASTVEAVYDAFALTLPANVTGLPSLSVPGLVSHAGVDLGLQVVGPPLSDARLLSFADRLTRRES